MTPNEVFLGICIRPGDARDEEVHHGPQLQEGVVQRGVDEQQSLLAEHTTGDDT